MSKEQENFVILEALKAYFNFCDENDVHYFNFFNNTNYSLDEYKRKILKLIKEKQ